MCVFWQCSTELISEPATVCKSQQICTQQARSTDDHIWQTALISMRPCGDEITPFHAYSGTDAPTAAGILQWALKRSAALWVSRRWKKKKKNTRQQEWNAFPQTAATQHEREQQERAGRQKMPFSRAAASPAVQWNKTQPQSDLNSCTCTGRLGKRGLHVGPDLDEERSRACVCCLELGLRVSAGM